MEEERGNSYEIVTKSAATRAEVQSHANDLTSKGMPNKYTREYKYITLKEAKANFTKFPSRNENTGVFLDKSDSETATFIRSVEEEIKLLMHSGTIDNVKLRGRKAKSFTAWVLLTDDKGELRIDELLLARTGAFDDVLKVTAVTLLISPKEERGLRISLDDHKVRLYEIINGSYIINFNWKVRGKHCSIAINIDGGGQAMCSYSSEGLTPEDLLKNTAVKIKIGDSKSREMSLKELASLGKVEY